MKLYYCGQPIGYLEITHFYREVDDNGNLRYIEDFTSSEHLINHVVNQEEDKKSGKWEEFQDIKTISFDIKDGFLYVNMYDITIDEANNNKEELLLSLVPKSRTGLPLSSIDYVVVHKEIEYLNKHHVSDKQRDHMWKREDR